jgi:hypothetical protein
VGILSGVDVVISCIVFTALEEQVHLAEAAKAAGVKRFVPCNFGTPAPRGVMLLDDRVRQLILMMKEIIASDHLYSRNTR